MCNYDQVRFVYAYPQLYTSAVKEPQLQGLGGGKEGEKRSCWMSNCLLALSRDSQAQR